ncbi:hypothetical protein CFB41_08770 [Burkholderia sp. AU33803]|nr:hypothetical protein CFB41_08770 [Burkholderia sp. AU33803]PRD97325.1 hypothetical protein C6P88_00885 [Burkholderia contaminans]
MRRSGCCTPRARSTYPAQCCPAAIGQDGGRAQLLNLIPVVGILGESASPIHFAGGAITIGAARDTPLRARRTELRAARA